MRSTGADNAPCALAQIEDFLRKRNDVECVYCLKKTDNFWKHERNLKVKVELVPLEEKDRNQFILDNQEEFRYGAMEEFGMRDNHF